jgi:rhodanese-related sulfurtransferase
MIDQVRPGGLAAWVQQAAGQGSGQAGAAPAVVLDVREPWELQKARIQADGFELLCIPMNEVPARLAELDPDRPLAVLCHHGARSQRVAMFLQGNGFEHLANIAGGIDAWSAEVDPTVPRY